MEPKLNLNLNLNFRADLANDRIGVDEPEPGGAELGRKRRHGSSAVHPKWFVALLIRSERGRFPPVARSIGRSRRSLRASSSAHAAAPGDWARATDNLEMHLQLRAVP